MSDLHTRFASVKSDLKDAIVLNPPYRNCRIDEMISNYHADPGRYFRETPFHATLFFVHYGGYNEYIGSCRVKRVHRLAEKAARRIIDRIFDNIKMHADKLAESRAMRLGIPREQLVTPQEEMIDEFLRAENRLIEDLRHKRQILESKSMVINDVAGMKLILDDSRQEQFFSRLCSMKDVEVIEIERHDGKYKATNLLLRLSPFKDQILEKPLSDRITCVMQSRGLSPNESNRAFADFVRSGEESVYMEIIVSNYEEMLESEIGRCMHEDRIIEQRLHQPYCGHLAKNVEYLMEYLFTFPASPCIDLNELPIKIWNRYLPDYFEDIVRRLFSVTPDMVLE